MQPNMQQLLKTIIVLTRKSLMMMMRIMIKQQVFNKILTQFE